VDLRIDFCGISSSNPFWLASGPPTDCSEKLQRAFDSGWAGAIWKTFGIKTKSPAPRLAPIYAGRNLLGICNIELISERPVKENLRDIEYIKKRYPAKVVFSSLMEVNRKGWQRLVKDAEDAGVDGHELNLSCPHGLSERGLGSAIGQVPEKIRQVIGWVKEVASKPVVAKLTPNITDIKEAAFAAQQAGAEGISLINTVNSIVGVDLESFFPTPSVGRRSTHGGFSGSGVKPIALYMVGTLGRDKKIKIPISGMGGISSWRECVEFMLLGARTVQVCTAVMLKGFGIIEDFKRGMRRWMKDKGFERVEDFIGASLKYLVDWKKIGSRKRIIFKIDRRICRRCYRCYISCRDAGGGAVELRGSFPIVLKERCRWCGLCRIVCPSGAIRFNLP
jgi:dihydropyrimidine dehydrogenase (NAD+) subunit PreA